MINDEKFLIAHIKIQAIDTTFLNICANLCLSLLYSSLTMLCINVKVAGDRFRSSVCIYEKRYGQRATLIPKVREMFTNGLCNFSGTIEYKT